MAIEGQEVQEERPEPSLRETLEASIATVERPEGEVAPAEGESGSAEDANKESAPAGDKPNVIDLNKPAEGAKPGVQPKPGDVSTQVEAAPKAWKASAQGKWAGLDPDVKAEVIRREKEITKVFGETGQMRQFAQNFRDTLQPHAARLQATGLQPLEAVSELLKADYILATAPQPQRAQFLAQLIKDYGIDVRALDSALESVLTGQPMQDPVESRLEQMLAERLTPLQNFLNQQQQTAQRDEQQMFQNASATINQMAQDNVKFPHFEQVRDDMADIIEMNARRNIYLTPEQAYQRAVGMNPEWAAASAQQLTNGRRIQQAQDANSRAQRALAASGSINGAPGGAPVGGAGAAGSLRDTIEAAFSQVAGR
jgi:hypothetical protein